MVSDYTGYLINPLKNYSNWWINGRLLTPFFYFFIYCFGFSSIVTAVEQFICFRIISNILIKFFFPPGQEGLDFCRLFTSIYFISFYSSLGSPSIRSDSVSYIGLNCGLLMQKASTKCSLYSIVKLKYRIT